ncbi:MAG: CPBP family intramembrane glutamic endopeptidase [Planctomycetota bacterium]|nr:CPBP family intramembrane glutamic endopeptidase [Planctomycetota bacterium]
MIRSSVAIGLVIGAIVGAPSVALGAPPTSGPADAGALRGLLEPWALLHLAWAGAAVAFVLSRGLWRLRARRVTGIPWWLWLNAAIASWLALGACAGLASWVLGGAGNASLRAQSLTALWGYAGGLLCALSLSVHLAKLAPASGLHIRVRGLLLGAALLALGWPLVQGVSLVCVAAHRLATGQPPEQISHPTLRALVDNPREPWAWLMVALAVLVAPVFEEVLYRGFLQSLAVRATGRPWAAVLLTSVIFAAAHLGQGMAWYSLAVIGALGVVLGAAYERTRSLGVPIAMHAIFNAANVALAITTA